ncbi:hypothetical protein ACWGJ2_16375 [Streptomyces sp. NPDC054796]
MAGDAGWGGGPGAQGQHGQWPGGGPGPYAYGPGGPGPYGAGPPPPYAPKPGVIPLHPLGVGDLLGAVFSTVGRYWKQLYGLTFALMGAALVAGAVVVGGALAVVWGTVDEVFRDVDHPEADGDQLLTLISAGVIAALLLIAIGVYVMSALTAAHAVTVSHAVTGHPLTLGALWRQTRPRVPSVVGVQLLRALIVCGLLAVGYGTVIGMIVGTIASAGESSMTGITVVAVLAGVLVFLGVAVAGTYLYVRYALAPSAAALEGTGAGASMSRSAVLVKGAWWRVLGITMLIAIIVAIVDQMVQYAVVFLGIFSAAAAGQDPHIGSMITVFAMMVVLLVLGSVLTVPFPYVAATLLYVDRRIRREGFDLTLAASAGLPPHRPPHPPAY